jgi:solute carrier family 13 (sodium-dependent dicarboxylate transporter), member 2/3/5
MIETSATTARWVRRVALAAGPLAAVALWTLLPIGTDPGMLTWTGRLTLGVAAWMAVWWLSEAVPLEATALLPLLRRFSSSWAG